MAATGVIIGNPVVIVLPLTILAVFPGLPVLFHSVYHFFVEYQILADRLVVIDRVSDPSVRSRGRQEIEFGSIAHCFYVDHEARLLTNLLTKLKPYNVPATETDYRKENLLPKYRVPEDVLEDFDRSTHKMLNNTTPTGVILEVKHVCERSGVPPGATREICKALERDVHISFETIQEKLSRYPVDPSDLERLRDEFASLDATEMSPFLVTRINLKKLKRVELSQHGEAAGIRSRVGLVLSSKGGTRKAYLMHFRDLSRRDTRELITAIRDRTHGVKFLMTRKELQALL
ncbi:MAG: hypothetical protein ACE5MG_00860, partial [Candidatus Methylomirabilales bacterium]